VIRFCPETGAFQLAGVEVPLEPRMSYADFRQHPAYPRMPEIRARRAENHREHDLPESTFEGCRVLGSISFTDDALESIWLQVEAEDGDGSLFRHMREDGKLIALQERWLRQVAGVESRDYPWGLVWNRYNINAGWHDIAIIFHQRQP